jgi:ectoine hydroxylase-related dioxygenase (phytanoyl-CoA dioxygenase family)
MSTQKTFDINDNFREMADYFHKYGYIQIKNAVEHETLFKLKSDLRNLNNKNNRPNIGDKRHIVHKCFFENSPTMVEYISTSKLCDFMQYIIADVPTSHQGGNSLTAHLIHNNAFTVPAGGRGQAPSWHTDDPLQNIILPQGMKLPDSVKLPVMVCTAMIWLSDCEYPDNGPTYVVPSSHRFGTLLDSVLADKLGIPACGKAGTAVLINNQLWHRGCENRSLIPRETVQITFGRRIIGHKFKSIMNYHMPDHVTRNKSDKVKERFGFLQGGAYS